MIRRFVPVYLITGFIESGKTTLGLTVLANDRFTNGGRVLVLCCEEGEAEWDDDSLEKYKGVLVNLDSADELTTAKLEDLDREIQPTCVIMEYNTMWGLEKLDEFDLPRLWGWAQVVTTADATTFDNYMANMRKILTDPMKAADMIYVNRCGEIHRVIGIFADDFIITEKGRRRRNRIHDHLLRCRPDLPQFNFVRVIGFP